MDDILAILEKKQAPKQKTKNIIKKPIDIVNEDSSIREKYNTFSIVENKLTPITKKENLPKKSKGLSNVSQSVNTTIQDATIQDATIQNTTKVKSKKKKYIKDLTEFGRKPEMLDVIGDETIDKRIKKQEIIKIKSSKYYLHNREIFVNFINSLYKKYKKTEDTEITCESQNDEFNLMAHQEIVRTYISQYAPYRGLLLFHGLGSGKTCSSIAIAEGIKTSRQVIVMTPASLRMNYMEELKKCGDEFYKKNQFWEFIETNDNVDLILTLSEILSLDNVFIQKQKGAWFMNMSKISNFDTLTTRQKKSLDKQLNEMILNKYEFWNYNGMRVNKYDSITQNNTINPFDNKIVIIDEAHNFVSRIVNKLSNSESLAMRMYEHLMSAENVKIVLLSGTPIINYPNEIAVLYNILRGYIKTWSIKLKIESTNKVTLTYLKSIITTGKLGGNVLDFMDYNVSNSTLEITKNPFGFVNIGKRGVYDGVRYGERGEIPDDDFLRYITKILKDNKIKVVNVKETSYKVLPDKLKDFNAYFIDTENNVKNMDMFRRRVLGLTSYFKDMLSLMPQYNKNDDFHVIKIPMSEYQFGIYEMARIQERKLEKNNAKKRKKQSSNDIYADTVSTYRIFSRAFCNFVFPEGEIKRPLPNNATEIDELENINENEMDAYVPEVGSIEDDEKLEEMQDLSYIERIQEAIKYLETNKETFFTASALENYSPKFSKVLEKLFDSDLLGKHLIYSQFRTMEGIGILKLVLEANGFAEFKITRATNTWSIDVNEEDVGKPMFALYTGTESQEEKEIIRNIYNGTWDYVPASIVLQLQTISNHENNMYGNVIKTLMISASGAEGISLKNVRYVHIIEPYWHPVRTQQVIGRARRICSHQELPIEHRTVDVFMYLMTFTQEQIESDGAIELRLQDRGKTTSRPLTSDEALYEISNIKEKINFDILNAVKTASMDCSIHNKDGSLECFTFGESSPEKYISYPSIENEDLDDTSTINKTEVEFTAREITFKGDKYAYDENTQKVYDYDDYVNGKITQVGNVVDGKIEFFA
tara:strand:- start:11234 stop:14365 length:3132 start_codon:yes stop_codon:yes gene_type:complete